MQESYPDNIMLCFVQGLGDTYEHKYNKTKEIIEYRNTRITSLAIPTSELKKITPAQFSSEPEGKNKFRSLITRKSFRFSSTDWFTKNFKRSLKQNDSIISDEKLNGLKSSVRKSWSASNCQSGSSGGGSGASRSAPATPVQIQVQTRNGKDVKQVVKPLGGTPPPVAPTRPVDPVDTVDSTECKPPSKSRQKKFHRHFPQVGLEERVVNYYSCALVGDILLQGHLYITTNYFAFYSNVFGYVTKLLIPTSSVLQITKEKIARIIPNAVGVSTKDERHVFGSLLSRDSTYKLMVNVWKTSRVIQEDAPDREEECINVEEAELEVSEYTAEDESSSGGAEHSPASKILVKRVSEPVFTRASSPAPASCSCECAAEWWRRAQWAAAAALLCALALALATAVRLHRSQISNLSEEEFYEELIKWRTKLQSQTAAELHDYLETNLQLLTKVRQSLQALSSVILNESEGEAVHIPSVPTTS